LQNVLVGRAVAMMAQQVGLATQIELLLSLPSSLK
jgi:hypothetical protein